MWNSATSSPVKLAGAGNHSTSASSIVEPSAGSASFANVAMRGDGTRPASAATVAPAAGPETRTTATPALPTALAGA
jgi:hypothetical protein